MTTIKDGEYTATIYKLIKDGQYVEAIHILNGQLQKHTKSRAALSLLGFCYYHIQDFTNAAECYEQLTQLHPEVEEYKVYYAQSLYKAGAYAEATKASFQLPQDDPDYIYNMGCLLYQDGKYEEACKKFTSAMQVLGYVPALSYNIALCYYSLKNYDQAHKYIGEIIERGIREHPELSIGMTTDGIDFLSVGNTLVLHQTALIEAFNLKAAIEYQQKNLKAAQEALTDMPPRSEEYMYEFLDALLTCQTAPEEAFRKFDEMIAKLTEQLRKLAKQLQEARLARDDEGQKKALQDYDLLQENLVSPLYPPHVVLRHQAEELMRKIEKEEEQISYDDPDKKVFHLCIVNLVIGTLYCAKGNYDFGISRVIKSLEPYNKKVGRFICALSFFQNVF
eukprot:superscaffoldBa00005742_g20732